MTLLATLRYEMFKRVRAYYESHSDSYPAGSFGAQLFAAIAGVITRLETLFAAQSSNASASRESSSSRAIAREVLHEGIEAINLSARAMAITIPGLENKFRLPRGQSDHALLAAARAFAKDAAPLKAEFIRFEMPADFLEDLIADIAHFEAIVSTHNLSSGSQVSATVLIEDEIEKGMNAVRELNAVVRNKHRNDRAALAAWESASHVERHSPRKPHSKKTDDTATDSGLHDESPNVSPTGSGSNPTASGT